MTNISGVISQIRFQLEQLSIKNAHHDFEHLCRHLTRARICSNIIPATGPVSAGGDQGRDFETFRTYLSSTPLNNSTFIGKISNKIISFACSLQKDKIIDKIKSDIKVITDSRINIEGIHYFCTSDIQVSKRHSLQKWTSKEFSVELEIYDGQAISELLADPEVFWIAEEYLNIPSEIFPRPIDEEDWYKTTIQVWKEKGIPYNNYADFYELKAAIRHATSYEEIKHDLPFWLGLLTKIRDGDYLPQLKRKAIYEISVASLKGQGRLYGQEEYLRYYFRSIFNLRETVELEDAAALLNYCIFAFRKKIINLTANELMAWRKKLTEIIDEMLKLSETPNRKCPLLEIRGYLSISIEPIKTKPPDINEALVWWDKLISIVKEAPLFPLERFADRLTSYIDVISIFGEIPPQYDNLAHQVDILLSERYGDFIAAEKCRDRAIKFYENENRIRAINELHQSKIKWFAEETLQHSLLSMQFISRMYLELGLAFAAKYYSLAEAYIAFSSSKPDVKELSPRALINTAECDYYQGFWKEFFNITDLGLRAYNLYSKEINSNTPTDVMERTIFHTTIIRTLTKKLNPELLGFVDKYIKNWNLEDYLEELISTANKTWEKKSVSEVITDLENQMGGPPWEDFKEEIKVKWYELGILWEVNWKNNYDTTAVAEQFIAILQILLADLANIDLCLLKTNITINISIENVTEIIFVTEPSNKGRKWNLILPTLVSGENIQENEQLQINILAVSTSILSEVSLLPISKFKEIIENSFKNGISMKVFVVQPYEILYQKFISKEDFNKNNKLKTEISYGSREFKIREHEDIAWFDKPGPGYSKETAEEYLKNRYSNLLPTVKYTLQRLLKNPEFKSLIKQLKSEEWLDWQILNSISSIRINYLIHQEFNARIDPYLYREMALKMLNKPEKEDSIQIPIEEFTKEKMRQSQQISMLSTLRILNLECRQDTPDFEAIEHFLRHRYNYWVDDIEHTDPFK